MRPTWTHQADNPQTGDQLYQRSSHTVMQVLGPTTNFPNLGIWQRDWEPPGSLIWRPVGFDYRTSTGLENRLLESTNKTLYTPRPRRKEQWPHRLSQTCLWVSRSLWQKHESTVACQRVSGTDYSSAGVSPFEEREQRKGTQPIKEIGLNIYWT